VFVGAVLGGIGVALGAFGAHGLRGRVDEPLLSVWETASRYHLIHALALLAVGWMAGRAQAKTIRIAGVAFVVGIVIFCGSLYTMTLTGVLWLGAVTPIGGVAFLIGWFVLAWAAIRGRGNQA
jgi:uncharacterized membrane protein YgdD (TMEM256/DUF423 family)